MSNSSKQTTNKYIIAESILFIASRRELMNTSTQQIIKLQVPASQCLELLLAEHGRVISQNELINQGWGEARGNTVSTNTFYQCILHLRKSLAAMGLPDVVITVPKQGLKISDDIAIGRVADSNVMESKVPAISKLKSDDGLNTMEKIAWRKKPALILSVALLVIVLAVIFTYLKSNSRRDVALSNLIQLNSPLCTVYVSNKSITLPAVNEALKTADLACKKSSVIYAFSEKMSSRLSLIYCQAYTKNNQNCLSVIIMKNGSKK